MSTHARIARDVDFLMNRNRSLATRASSGAWVAFSYGLVMVAMCYGYFTLALMVSDRDQAHVGRLLEQLDQSGARNLVDSKRIVVNMRLLLPQLAVVDADQMQALRGTVDALEAKLVEQSRDGDPCAAT